MEDITITYRYLFADGSRKVFNIVIDPRTLCLKNKEPSQLPAWTDLEFFQCRNCPLTPSERPRCPLAMSLVDIVNSFRDLFSYEEVTLEVITAERTIVQSTTIQRAVSSLMGLVIATSGCPHTVFFKPMARFHLPLASEEETIYRATSMYLLAQHFVDISMRKAHAGLDGLKKIYENIQIVNGAIIERLRSAGEEDASANAVIILDAFAKALLYVIEDSLEELQYLFTAYAPGTTGTA